MQSSYCQDGRPSSDQYPPLVAAVDPLKRATAALFRGAHLLPSRPQGLAMEDFTVAMAMGSSAFEDPAAEARARAKPSK